MSESIIRLLSAGAVKTGVRAAADAFKIEGLGTVEIRFATAPTIRSEVSSGAATADVLVLPPGGMNAVAKPGRVEETTRVMLGKVGAGVAVRDGARIPDISSLDAIKRELAAADSVAFNKASTGLYIESLFEKLGIAAELAPKIRRQDNGAGVMHHLLQNVGYDLGFGAITEILVFTDRGIRLVGPLPEEIQNYTRYEAAVMRNSREEAGARAFVSYLGSEQCRRLLAECGIEPA